MSRSKRKPYDCPTGSQQYERKLHNHLLRRKGKKYLQLIEEDPGRDDIPKYGTLKKEGLDGRDFKPHVWWRTLDQGNSKKDYSIELSRK